VSNAPSIRSPVVDEEMIRPGASTGNGIVWNVMPYQDFILLETIPPLPV